MSTIVPAILEQTIEGFQDKSYIVTRLPQVSRIHVDFADGKFVPSRALSIENFEPLNPAFEWEAHLMIDEPVDFLDYQIAGFKTIVVHFEAYKNPERIIEALKEIRKLGMTAGLAINPETEISALAPFKEFINQITVMSVKPGYQGSPFEQNALEKVRKLKALWPNVIIEIDGSVNEATIESVCSSGPDLLVVGSAIVKAPDPLSAYNKLQQVLSVV